MALAVLQLTGCGAAPAAKPTSVDPVPGPSAEKVVAGWPSVDTAAVTCVVTYPDDLTESSVAFDGTVVGVQAGEPQPDAGGDRPVRLELRVNQRFKGAVGAAVVMKTWDFMLPGEDVTGVRVLAAAGESLDLMGCGFTRPYSPEEAAVWAEAFAAN